MRAFSSADPEKDGVAETAQAAAEEPAEDLSKVAEEEAVAVEQEAQAFETVEVEQEGSALAEEMAEGEHVQAEGISFFERISLEEEEAFQKSVQASDRRLGQALREERILLDKYKIRSRDEKDEGIDVATAMKEVDQVEILK